MKLLTQKASYELRNSFIGFGYILCHTGNNEITKIEFGRGKNGKFYAQDGTELPEFQNIFTYLPEED